MFQRNIPLNIFKAPLSFYRNIKDGYITPQKTGEQQKEHKSNINEIMVGSKKSEDQKSTIKNVSTNREKKLLNCLMIILELYLKLNSEQNTEEVSKY